MSAANPRVAIIWSRFGPYHLARLRGAAAAGAQINAEIHGIEVAERDSIYEWNSRKSGNEFVRHTVFPGQDYVRLSSRMIADATVRSIHPRSYDHHLGFMRQNSRIKPPIISELLP